MRTSSARLVEVRRGGSSTIGHRVGAARPGRDVEARGPGAEDVGRPTPVSVVLRLISSANELPSSWRQEVQAVEPLEVVEAVGVLQALQLFRTRS